MAGKSKQQRGMEEAPENGEESSHSAHANGMNECEVCFASTHITNFALDFLGSQFQTQKPSTNTLINSGLLHHFWIISPVKNAAYFLSREELC